MDDALLSICGLEMCFGAQRIFADVDLRLNAGEIVGISAASGSGKTTLLRIIAGLESNYGGCVRHRARRIAYVFQDTRLLPWLSAEDNVALPLFKTLGRNPARERARYYLERLRLEGCRNKRPSQLSGGMAQRVGLARALAFQADLLLLDEPFSSLDDALRDHVLTLVGAELRRNNTAALFVSHQLCDLQRLTERIVTW